MTDPNFSDFMKEQLCQEYLKSHPGTHKEEIVIHFKNGQYVAERISDLKQDAFQRKSGRDFQKNQNQLLTQHMEEYSKIGPTERHQSCLQSIHHSKKIIENLFASQSHPFGQKEKEEHLRYLQNKEQMNASAVKEVIRTGKKLAEIMDQKGRMQSKIHLLTMQYLESLLEQLKSQVAIYNREVELSALFIQHVQQVIEKNFPMIKTTVPKPSLIKLVEVYTYMKKEKVQMIDMAELNVGMLNATIHRYEEKLKTRSALTDYTGSIIGALEQIIEKQKTSDEKGIESDPKTKETSPPQDDTKMEAKRTKGRAFTTRLFSKFRNL